ncbi:MAG: heavy-metal-associated domain-containing protein [Marinoscillum sp.]
MELNELTKQEYGISGMTCDGCIAKVSEILNEIEGVTNAKVQLKYPQATVEMEKPLNLDRVNQLLREKGRYAISSEKQELAPLPVIGKNKESSSSLPGISFSTYKPLIIIVSFIFGVSLLTQYPFSDFSGMLWMRHFMAGFFLVFSFFKLLNLSGFASSYSMYDIVATRWKSWGYVYPFVELGLGISYLINFAPFYTNLITVVVLGISSIGVIESNLNKRKIKCACLGDVFNLPMSTVTIIEDLAMVAMAGWMLFIH